MKKISILIPCYNEEENVVPISKALCNLFECDLQGYDYELLFIDNDSTDNTRPLLREICADNNHIKAIFNAKNFGQISSPYYGLLQTTGDCTIAMACDFQDPIELIPRYISEWENGYKIVIGIKSSSKESRIMYRIRTLYYKIVKRLSSVEQIEHFTGFGLYDKDFIEVLRNLKDPVPFLRGIVAELGYKRKEILFEQPKRRAGKTKNNFYSLYDVAMLGFTSYTKVGLRMTTFVGIGIGIISVVIGFIYLILKLVFWNWFSAGMAPMLIGIFFLGAVQLFFLGIMGEYVLSINQRVMNRPLVIEEERLNFQDIHNEKRDDT